MEELEALDQAVAEVIEATAALASRRAERNAAIVAAFDAGMPIGGLAERSGLGRTTVQDILGNPYGKVGRPRNK